MYTEIWKPIVGYEGLYEISNLGNVRRIKGSQSCKNNRILKNRINNKGYFFISLSKESNVLPYTIHRLVAIHFVENPNNYPIVMHLDNNPKNNNYDNLKWGTMKENSQQMWDEKRHKIYTPNKGKFGMNNHLSVTILQYSLEGILLNTHFGIAEAQRNTGVNKTCIGKCCRGIQKSAGGFVWKYKL